MAVEHVSPVDGPGGGAWPFWLSAGMLEMSDYNAAIPANVISIAEAAEAGIMDGSLNPFAGPIRNQAGELLVPKGEAVADGDLLSMDWYVEGVQGSIPQ